MAGFVNSTDFAEIVCACYSGKIISFTSEPIHKRAAEDTYGRSIQNINDENRIKNLRKELETLQTRVDKEKEKLKKLSTKAADAVTLSAQDFHINARFTLDEDLAAYILSVELQTPIDSLVLRSPVHLEMVDSEDRGCSVYITPTDHDDELHSGNSSRFIAACKCPNAEKRLTLAFRTTEGSSRLSVLLFYSVYGLYAA